MSRQGQNIEMARISGVKVQLCRAKPSGHWTGRAPKACDSCGPATGTKKLRGDSVAPAATEFVDAGGAGELHEVAVP